MFRVLVTPQKEKPDYLKLYLQVFSRKAKEYQLTPNRQILKQVIFYGIKIISHERFEDLTTYEEYLNDFKFATYIISLLSSITPAEFMTIFPVRKSYDGKRFQCKDYFTTMEEIKKHGLNTPIDEGFKFISDYYNIDCEMFWVNVCMLMSRIRQCEGHKDLLKEFFESQGKPLTTYTLYKDNNGKEFMQNNTTGEVTRVRKRIPRYLKVVN